MPIFAGNHRNHPILKVLVGGIDFAEKQRVYSDLTDLSCYPVWIHVEFVSIQKWKGTNWCPRKFGRDQGALKS